jgi:hypothetical protein
MPRGYFNNTNKPVNGMLGKKHSVKTRQKMRGRIPWNKGKKWPESKKWLKSFKKGGIPWNKGKYGLKMSEKARSNMSLAQGGNGIPFWGSRPYHHLRSLEYKQWRSKVFERDNWICQTCGRRSESGNIIYLEVHHIKNWAKYPKLRYEVENGVTLCRDCHRLTRN